MILDFAVTFTDCAIYVYLQVFVFCFVKFGFLTPKILIKSEKILYSSLSAWNLDSNLDPLITFNLSVTITHALIQWVLPSLFWIRSKFHFELFLPSKIDFIVNFCRCQLIYGPILTKLYMEADYVNKNHQQCQNLWQIMG